ELFVPCGSQALSHCIKVPLGDLSFEVVARLIDAQEGGAHSQLDGFSWFELRIGATAGFRHFLFHSIGLCIVWDLLELDNKIALEVRQLARPKVGIHAVWVVSTDLMGLLIDHCIAGHSGSGRLYQHARVATLGKAKSEYCASLGRRHLHPNIVTVTGVKRNSVIVGARRLGAVFEWQFAAVRGGAQWPCLRHDRHITVVPHPDRRLMCTDKA